MAMDEEKLAIFSAIELLKANGYIVVKAKSYYKAQERQRIAAALLECEKEAHQFTLKWGQQAWGEQRKAWDRASFLYGECLRRGAAHDDLRQPGEIKNEPKPALEDVLIPYVITIPSLQPETDYPSESNLD